MKRWGSILFDAIAAFALLELLFCIVRVFT